VLHWDLNLTGYWLAVARFGLGLGGAQGWTTRRHMKRAMLWAEPIGGNESPHDSPYFALEKNFKDFFNRAAMRELLELDREVGLLAG
jgi:hypothetical protein